MAKIGRDILKQFLPNHETIVAFEKLLNFVDTTAPTQLEEILVLVSSIKRINTADISARLAAMEVPLTRGRNIAPLEARLNEATVPTAQRPNLSNIYARLEALEALQRRTENHRAILTRLENIEKFIGI